MPSGSPARRAQCGRGQDRASPRRYQRGATPRSSPIASGNRGWRARRDARDGGVERGPAGEVCPAMIFVPATPEDPCSGGVCAARVATRATASSSECASRRSTSSRTAHNERDAVRVDEAWQDRAPMKINRLGERAGERAHVGVVAGRQDAPESGQSPAPDARCPLVHCMDDAVDQQEYRTVGQWHGALLQGGIQRGMVTQDEWTRTGINL